MTKPSDAFRTHIAPGVIWDATPWPCLDDGTIDWERSVERVGVSAETMERMDKWSREDPERAQLVEMEVREFFEHCVRTPPDPRISAVLERLKGLHQPAMRADLDDLFEDFQNMLGEAVSVLAPQRMPSSRRGRHPKQFVPDLLILAGARLHSDGLPDTQEEVADILRDLCDTKGWEYGDTQIRELARRLFKAHEAALST
jgi:hypothetical protein